VDTALRTQVDGVFAAGNVLHPVDTADVAALDGAAVADAVCRYLDGQVPGEDHVRLYAGEPFRWVAPAILRPGDPAPPRGRLLLWTDRYVRAPRLAVSQNGRIVARTRIWWPAAPGRVFRVPSDILDPVDRRGGPVTLGLDG
jgi:hypothetical protein